MTGTQVAQLMAATRHSSAIVRLWHAQRLELVAHGEWTRALTELGPCVPKVDAALQAFDVARSHTATCAAELADASDALAASMLAVQQEARR